MTVLKQYGIPLMLTTPLMTGQPVKDAQWLLAGNSRFDGLATYKDAPIDGAYGPLTAQATARAKYWLGYPEQSCTGVFGQTLYEYLLPPPAPKLILPALYQERRAARLKAAELTTGAKALAWARTQLGQHETPWGSNCQQYGVEYGFNCVAWCAIFVSISFKRSGYTGFRYSYVPSVVDAARAGGRMRIVFSPAAGDLVCHTVHGTPNAHISFFDHWVDEHDGVYRDLGGNTGPSSVSNGGAVMEQTRYRANVTHFVRVN